jgi:hypothetical protein
LATGNKVDDVVVYEHFKVRTRHNFQEDLQALFVAGQNYPERFESLPLTMYLFTSVLLACQKFSSCWSTISYLIDQLRKVCDVAMAKKSMVLS